MDRIHPVSDAELEILRVLWQQDKPMLLSPLMDALAAAGKQWKPNTVLTFLARLADKGMVSVRKDGRLNEYAPLCSEAEYLSSLTRTFVDSVYGGDAKGLVAALLRQEHLTGADMDELRAFWEEANRHA